MVVQSALVGVVITSMEIMGLQAPIIVQPVDYMHLTQYQACYAGGVSSISFNVAVVHECSSEVPCLKKRCFAMLPKELYAVFCLCDGCGSSVKLQTVYKTVGTGTSAAIPKCNI